MTGRPQTPHTTRDCPHDGRHQHGTTAAYKQDWCRCEACRAACAADWRNRSKLKAYGRYPEHRINPTGAERRLRALAAMGWGTRAVAAATGIHSRKLHDIRGGHQQWISRNTDTKIRTAYDQLWDKQPPQRDRHNRGGTARAQRSAQQAGWLPPMAYDDDTIDNPAAEPHQPARDKRTSVDPVVVHELTVGRRVAANQQEIRAAVKTLTERGIPASEIAHLLRREPRSIQRLRHVNRTKAEAAS